MNWAQHSPIGHPGHDQKFSNVNQKWLVVSSGDLWRRLGDQCSIPGAQPRFQVSYFGITTWSFKDFTTMVFIIHGDFWNRSFVDIRRPTVLEPNYYSIFFFFLLFFTGSNSLCKNTPPACRKCEQGQHYAESFLHFPPVDLTWRDRKQLLACFFKQCSPVLGHSRNILVVSVPL